MLPHHSPIPLSNTNSFIMSIFKVAITLSFILSLIVLLPKSVSPMKSRCQDTSKLAVNQKTCGSVLCDKNDLEERKVVIGSKPPLCVNKCKKCRPCMATVVVNDHDHQRQKKKDFKFVSSDHEEDSYYLLSWKCRCGNKFFQP